LDSAATFDICNLIKILAQGFQTTALVALQQVGIINPMLQKKTINIP